MPVYDQDTYSKKIKASVSLGFFLNYFPVSIAQIKNKKYLLLKLESAMGILYSTLDEIISLKYNDEKFKPVPTNNQN